MTLNYNFIIEEFPNNDIWQQVLESFGATRKSSDSNLWEIDFILTDKKRTKYNLPKIDINKISLGQSTSDFISEINNKIQKENEKIIKNIQIAELSQTEKSILIAIYKSGKSGITISDLLKTIGYEAEVNSHTIQTHLHSIRKKINKEIEVKNGKYNFK